MIFISDLQIGDLVLYKKEISRVIRLHRQDNTVCVVTESVDYKKTWFGEIYPIPMTPEWLTENRFISYEGCGGHPCYSLTIGNLNELYAFFENDLYHFTIIIRHKIQIHIQIKYVHVLQNALRLAGLDILADSFQTPQSLKKQI